MGKTNVILLVAVILALMVDGALLWRRCATNAASAPAPKFESDMIEVLVRNILAEPEMHQTAICFLTLGAKQTTPSRKFIKRFSNIHPTVRGGNDFVSPAPGKYFEISTGTPGTLLQIIKIQQQEFISSAFNIEVALSNLPPGHDHLIYHMANIGGKWMVENHKPE